MGKILKAPDDFRKIIRDLKSGNYYDLIGKLQEYLELAKYGRAEIEAMLIRATKQKYPNNMFEADITLMALGLLKGFDNRSREHCVDVSNAKKLFTERNENFLKYSTYIKTFYPYNSYEDAKKDTRIRKSGKTALETIIDSLESKQGRYLNNVADLIYSKRGNIGEYVELSSRKYTSTEKEYIPEECLPELQHPRKDQLTEPKKPKPKKPKPRTVDSYLKTIQASDKYDDVSEGLYYKLCRPKADPPYDEWVATWLIKCIDEEFGETFNADILHVSFALLPGYKLAGTCVEERLEHYLNNSIYPSFASDGKYRDIDDIEDEEQIEKYRKELRSSERQLLAELVRYVNQLGEPVEHINNLDKYGELKEYDGKKIYKPHALKLYNNKNYLKLQAIINKILSDKQKYSADIDTISSKYELCMILEKLLKTLACPALSLLVFCVFLAMGLNTTVATFDKNPYSNLSGIPSCMDYRDSVISHNSMLPVDSEEPYLEHLAMDNSED